MTFRRIVLWLFVLDLGITFGAGLYEALVEVPHWLVNTGGVLTWNAEAARSANSGMRFWAFVSTGPLTLLMILNGIAAWKTRQPLRRWWLASVVLVLLERALTFGYFIPTMIGLMDAASTTDSVATALVWERLNCLRHVLNFSGWVAALKAFAFIEANHHSTRSTKPA